MKFGALFKGKEKRAEEKVEKAEKKERGIDELLLDTDMKLRVLYDKYKVILNRELIIAKANQRKNIKNQDNYSKIGIAYYSMLMVKRAQERMRDMKSTRSLYNCMNELNQALQAINGLNGQLGKVSAKKTVSSMKKMESSSGSSSVDLKKTFNSLNGLNEQLPGQEAKNTGVDQLISVDLIERLISGEDVERCVREEQGLNEALPAGGFADVLSDLNDLPQDADIQEEEHFSADEIREMLDQM